MNDGNLSEDILPLLLYTHGVNDLEWTDTDVVKQIIEVIADQSEVGMVPPAV